MTPSSTTACPRCRQPIAQGSKFCANCGNDISGVWSTDPALGGTIAVEVDPNVDTLGQLLSEATLGEYDIYGELGRGGMAAVYLALDLSLNRKVAIKTMLPELVGRGDMVQRFKREAQTAAALNHPHIIQIYTVKETKQLVYFVMKFVEGRSLESVITDKGHVPIAMAQTMLGQVGSALDYAHRKHVVHRDIKPANIMIDEDGWAIVTDFGIAKVQEAQNLTATGTAIGTPHYMSPEQFHNKAVTGQSDQYSLGVVLYEMLAGKKPFDGGTYAEIITQHLFEPVPDLRQINADVPEHVVEVIRKMMAKDPAERYPDVDTAIHALGAPMGKKEGDVVRTQMISLAKSGPQKKLRMSVPMSPIPVTRRPAPPAPTAIEPAPPAGTRKPRPKPAPTVVEAKSRTGLIAATIIGLAVLGGGGFAAMKLMNRGESTPLDRGAQSPVVETTPTAPPQQSPPPATQPAATVAAAPTVDTAKLRADSIRRAARLDSIRIADASAAAERRRLQQQQAAAAPTKTAAISTPTQTRPPAAIQQAAPPPAPAAPAVGAVRMGSTTPGAVLYINGRVESALSSIRIISVPAGSVRLAVNATGCQPWDSTVNVPAGDTVTVGRRFAKCP